MCVLLIFTNDFCASCGISNLWSVRAKYGLDYFSTCRLYRMCILMSAYVDYPIGADEKEESLVRQGILLEDMIDNEFLP